MCILRSPHGNVKGDKKGNQLSSIGVYVCRGTIKTGNEITFFSFGKLVKPSTQNQLSYIKTLSLHSPINKTQKGGVLFSWRFCINQPQTNNNPKTTSLLLYQCVIVIYVHILLTYGIKGV